MKLKGVVADRGLDGVVPLKEAAKMTNCQIAVEGETLIIKVNLAHEGGVSKSGKSVVIASTEGNVSVNSKGGAVKVGLNVYKPRE